MSKRRKARNNYGYAEYQIGTPNPHEKPAVQVFGFNKEENRPFLKEKSINQTKLVEVHSFVEKKASRKGLRNLKAIKKFIRDQERSKDMDIE